MVLIAVVSFLLGVFVGGFIVYKNIDAVVEERFQARRRSRRDE